MNLSPGSVIGAKYQLVRPLAHGGMGSVWVARHTHLDMAVALKLMTPTSKTARARFEREAKAVARLRSPHVVTIHDYGFEQSVPYIVMELMEGEDLRTRLKREGQLSLSTAAHISTQIAKALKRAHAAGIVHRDLKPANIFITRNDDDVDITKILDFGIVKDLRQVNSSDYTKTGVIVGTVQYMSPEQAMGSRDIDHRSDLWSLGVILFRAITGYTPFSGFSVMDIVHKIVAGRIPTPSHFAPELSAEVDEFFSRALSRDRAQRFQSAEEMANAFARVASPRGSRSSLSLPAIGLSGSIAVSKKIHEIELSSQDLVSVSLSDLYPSVEIEGTMSSDEHITAPMPRRTLSHIASPAPHIMTSSDEYITTVMPRSPSAAVRVAPPPSFRACCRLIAASMRRGLLDARRRLGIKALAIGARSIARLEVKLRPYRSAFNPLLPVTNSGGPVRKFLERNVLRYLRLPHSRPRKTGVR